MDRRRRSTSGGGSGSGKLTGILAAILGNGGEATPNQEVDVPEFSDEANYIGKKGKLTSQPFSSNYNFFDRMAGRQDQGATLNAEVALNQITLDQALNNLLKQNKSLLPLQAESERVLGGVRRDNLLKERQTIDPLDVNKTFQNTWAAKGVAPTDLDGLSTATARNTLDNLGIAQTGNEILASVMRNPANRSILEAGQLAKEVQPIATLRRGMETSLGPNEFMQREGVGNTTLDKLLSPGIGYGATETMGTTKAKLGNMEYDVPTKITTPGRFTPRIAIDPAKKAAVMGGSSTALPMDLPSSFPTQVPAGLNPPPAPDQSSVVDGLLKQIKKNSTGDPMLDIQRILNAAEIEKLRKSGILDRLKGL